MICAQCGIELQIGAGGASAVLPAYGQGNIDMKQPIINTIIIVMVSFVCGYGFARSTMYDAETVVEYIEQAYKIGQLAMVIEVIE